MPENRAETIDRLVASLASEDPVQRQHARDQLVEMGGQDVTRALVLELTDPHQHVRWEAAKALAAIADPVAAPGLMHALEDEDQDVRWVAGEGLVALGEEGLLTVLNGLTKRAMSLDYRTSAHHVLHDLKKHGFQQVIAPVLESLDSSEPAVTAPPAAYEALVTLKHAGR